MYDANLGRFASRDPIGYRDGNSLVRAYFAPQNLDPTGLQCKRPVCCRFRLGWVIPQYTTKELDCGDGQNASQCCDDYAQRWYRLWRTDAFFDGNCDRNNHPVLVLMPAPVTTTPIAPTVLLPKVHPVAVICLGLLIGNQCFIDDQPGLDVPEFDPEEVCTLCGFSPTEYCEYCCTNFKFKMGPRIHADHACDPTAKPKDAGKQQ